MARKDEVWTNKPGGYIQTINPLGYDVLINGLNRYENFNTVSGSLGYGFRDNAGIMEVKNLSGVWVPINSNIGDWAGTWQGYSPSYFQVALGFTAENITNKVTSISGSSTDVQYPSAKLLYDQLLGKQATGLDWLLNGNTLGSKKTLGSIDNQDIGFLTNNTERITVLNNGNVGIGTTSPLAKLTIVDSAGSDDGTQQFTIGANSAYHLAMGYSNGGSTVGYLANNYTDGTARLDFRVGGLTNTSTKLAILQNGNVGIGTTAPRRKLEIYGGGSQVLVNSTAAVENSEIGFATEGALKWRTGYGIGIGGDVYEIYDSVNSLDRMVIKNNGNVGIGTTGPLGILDVTSTTSAFLPPRMTTTQKAAIATPTAGMVVYDATLNKLSVYTGAVWETVTSI